MATYDSPPASFESFIKAEKAKYLRRGWPADLEVQCGQTLWVVHKQLITATSDFFDRAVDMTKSEAKQPTRLKIAEELAPVAQSFFEFVYTGDYQVLDLDMEEEDFHLEVLSLAKRFETSELAELAYEKMHEAAAKKNVTVPEIDLATWLKEKDSMESSVVETAESSVGETTEPSVSEIVDSETGGVHLSQGFRTPSQASKE